MQFKVTLLISSLLLGAASASPLKMAAGNAANTKSQYVFSYCLVIFPRNYILLTLLTSQQLTPPAYKFHL